MDAWKAPPAFMRERGEKQVICGLQRRPLAKPRGINTVFNTMHTRDLHLSPIIKQPAYRVPWRESSIG